MQRTVGTILLAIAAGCAYIGFGVEIPSEWTVEAIARQFTLPRFEAAEAKRWIALIFGVTFSVLGLVQFVVPPRA